MDFLYLVGPGDKEELRWSLRSVHAHFKVDSVTVVGHKPGWLVGVEFLPSNRHADRSKFSRIWRDMLLACQSDVPDRFVYCNDDMFALRRTRIPNWHKGPMPKPQPPRRNRKETAHRHGIAHTAWLLGKWGHESPLNYELHVPMMVERDVMREVLEAGQRARIEALQARSLYGNCADVGGVERDDVKVSSHRQSVPDDAAWVSTNDRTFGRGRVGKQIRGLYPDPSPYERS